MLMPLLDPNHTWLWWIIIGGIAGGIAKLLMPGRDPGGCIITILLGIAGDAPSLLLAGVTLRGWRRYRGGRGGRGREGRRGGRGP